MSQPDWYVSFPPQGPSREVLGKWENRTLRDSSGNVYSNIVAYNFRTPFEEYDIGYIIPNRRGFYSNSYVSVSAGGGWSWSF